MEAFDTLYQSPVGWLGVKLQDDNLTNLAWLTRPNSKYVKPITHSKVNSVTNCLDHYFKTATVKYPIALTPTGTDFQQRVWTAIQKIPLGKVKTYGELAAELDTSSRAIGQACKNNPIPIFIPCHRVVAANNVGGFMGDPNKVYIKQWLLEHEGIH